MTPRARRSLRASASAAPDSTRGARRVWWLVAALVAAAATSHLLLLDRIVLPSITSALPWVVVAGLFALAELAAVHIFFKREAYSPSMTEVPLLVSLVALSPDMLVVAALVGVSLELALRRRQPLLKLSFNLAMVWLETVWVIVVYALLLGSHSPIALRGWMAAFVAMLLHEAIDATLVPLAATSPPRPGVPAQPPGHRAAAAALAARVRREPAGPPRRRHPGAVPARSPRALTARPARGR